jgi:two-component system OmpR family response regulator
MRVLVVEDDNRIASFVTKGLNQAGFTVDVVDNGEEGLDLATTRPYDVAVVDVMLPRLDGLTLIGELRRKRIMTPVVILSARRTVDDRVTGLRTGSDDYMTKPFAFEELLARIQAVMRRTTGGSEPTRLAAGELAMDLLSREVVRAGRRLDLQPREFSLLEYLLRNTGRVVSKTMILEHVWNYSFDPQTNVVEVLVCRLRG